MTWTATVFASLLPLVAVGAADAGAESKAEAFHRQALAQRAALQLDATDPRLRTQYPAPELTPGDVGLACAGQRLPVKVAGRFVPGSLVTVLSEDVVVVSEKLSASAWEAVVQVRPDAPPGDVLVRVTSPVSEAWRASRLLDVGCQHRWTLDLATGERLTVVTRWPAGANTGVKADGQWTRGTQVLGPVKLEVRGTDAFVFERLVSPEYALAEEKLGRSPELKAIEARAADAQANVNRCAAGPAPQQASCLKKNGDALARASAERAALVDKALGAVTPRFGCAIIRLAREGRGLVGVADRCAGASGPTAVRGTVAAEN